MNADHPIYIARLEDGTFLAASNSTPRFCVGAETKAAAVEKAERALEFYRQVPRRRPIVDLAWARVERRITPNPD